MSDSKKDAQFREGASVQYNRQHTPSQPWLTAMEADPALVEVENRPWANEFNRDRLGCKGNDFVHHSPRVLMRFFWNAAEERLQGSCFFTKEAEGPPGGAHGASVALVFDEILAYPVWRTGYNAFTVNLNLNLRSMVPLGSVLRFDAKIARKEGRKLFLSGEIRSGDLKTLYSTCTGIWLDSNKLGKFDLKSTL